MDITRHSLERLNERFGISSQSEIKDILSILGNPRAYKVQTHKGHYEGKHYKFKYKGVYIVAVVRNNYVLTFKTTDKIYKESQMNKELSTEKTMTVKEVAEIMDKDISTIRKIGKTLFPEVFKHGIVTNLTEKQVTAIKLNLGKNSSLPKTELEKELLIQQAMQFQQEKIIALQTDNKQLQDDNTALKIELDKEKAWYSVKRVKGLGLLPEISARSIWSPLKKWSIEHDYQIKTIFDANYGNVKTYHADAWKGVYNLDLYFGGE